MTKQYEYGYMLPPNKLDGETEWIETILGPVSESDYNNYKLIVDCNNEVKCKKVEWFIREVKS